MTSIKRVREQDEFTPLTANTRVRCRAQLSLPSPDGRTGTMFKCNTRTQSDHPRHAETGRLKRRDGKVFTYFFSWVEEVDSEGETWREERVSVSINGSRNAGDSSSGADLRAASHNREALTAPEKLTLTEAGMKALKEATEVSKNDDSHAGTC